MLVSRLFLLWHCSLYYFSYGRFWLVKIWNCRKKAIQKNYLEQLNNTYEGTLKALSYALDLRDHGIWGHSARVVSYTLAIAEKIGLTQQALRQSAWAGILHDIGKIGVPDSILLKKAALDPDEWENVKRHPTIGYEVIREINFLKFAADIVLYHHEHYDGSGYPRALRTNIFH
jgi:putative nucleotidyltransferase with HDIG domain